MGDTYTVNVKVCSLNEGVFDVLLDSSFSSTHLTSVSLTPLMYKISELSTM